MNLDIHSLISENISRGIPFVLSTVIRTEGSTPSVMGSRMIIYRDGKTEGTVGGGALEHLVIDDSKQIFSSGMNLTKTYDLTDKEQGTGMECGGMVEIMFEVFTKRPHIMIFGGGHIALELSKILDIIRFEYSVIDNRKEFAEKTRFPRAVKIYHGDYADFDFEAEITDNCYGVIVTHGHEYDKECLAKLIKTQARYIGMIGSKICLLYTSPSPRDRTRSRMPSSA